MLFLTINTRGLCNSAKQTEVGRLLRSENIDFCFIQETKMESVDHNVRRKLWHSDNFDWAFEASEGRSGGLLCLWDSTQFSKVAVQEGNGFLLVEGYWGRNRVPCSLINVYAPCTRSGRFALWQDLSSILKQKGGRYILGGDFNAVLSRNERIGSFYDLRSMIDSQTSLMILNWWTCRWEVRSTHRINPTARQWVDWTGS